MPVSCEIASYREIAVDGASPIELTIMLCDALIRDLKLVVDAIREHRIEDRVRHSCHAYEVLQEMETMLNFHDGGETARELQKVYSWVRAKLLESQIKLQPAMVERQIEFIEELRQAWKKAWAAITLAQARPAISTEAASLAAETHPYAMLAEAAPGCSWSA